MERYLPLGTIILLKDANKKLMIYGRRQLMADTGEFFDYVGCLYPEGNISPKYTFLFNHEDIGAVIFTGYSDAEEEEYVNDIMNL